MMFEGKNQIIISDELKDYLDGVINLLDNGEDTYEELIWNLIKVSQIKGKINVPLKNDVLYG